MNFPTPTAAPLVTDAPEDSLKLTAEIEYTPATSGELTRLALTDSAKSLPLDLDGDGREEQLYCAYVNGEPWQLISDIRLYADPHSEAESITAQSGQKVYQLKIHFSDYGRCWIFITTEHGEEGWFYAEYTDDATWTINQETDARDIINGFSSVN